MPAGVLAGIVARLGFRSEQEFLTAMMERAAEECTVDVRFVVRGGDFPGIAVIGRFDDVWAYRFSQLLDQVVDRLVSWNHIGFHDAISECELLAERLVERVGARWLDEARFVGLPRGGLIVVGLLSMVMGVPRGRVSNAGGINGEPVVIVDDCALTGYRLREYIASTGSSALVCAFLRAPAELCRAVEAAEPRVKACLAAGALRHIGPDDMGADYDPWLSKLAARVDSEGRYWIGQCESVTYAWKEPDRFYFNEVTGQPEPAWHVMPREVCIAGCAPQVGVKVWKQTPGIGPVRPAANVYWTPMDDGVVVADVPGGDVVELDAVASAIWLAFVEKGRIDDVVAAVLEIFEVDEMRLRADVELFTTSLLRRGFLTADN